MKASALGQSAAEDSFLLFKSLPFRDLLAGFLHNGSAPEAAGSICPAPIPPTPSSAPAGLPPERFSGRPGLRGVPGGAPATLHASFLRPGEVIFCTMASSLRPRPFRGGSTLVLTALGRDDCVANPRHAAGGSRGGGGGGSPLPLGLALWGEAILLKRPGELSALSSLPSTPLPLLLRRMRLRFLAGTGAMKADFRLSVWRALSESLLPVPGLGTLPRWLIRPSFWGPLETLNAVGKWLLAGGFLVGRQSGILLSEGRRRLAWKTCWGLVRDRRTMDRWSLPGMPGESGSLVLEPMGLLSEATGRAAGLLGLDAALGDGFPTRLPDLKAARCFPPSLSGGVGVVVRPGGPGVWGSLRAVRERVHILGSPSDNPRPGAPAPSA